MSDSTTQNILSWEEYVKYEMQIVWGLLGWWAATDAFLTSPMRAVIQAKTDSGCLGIVSILQELLEDRCAFWVV